eukprot:g60718.t1
MLLFATNSRQQAECSFSTIRLGLSRRGKHTFTKRLPVPGNGRSYLCWAIIGVVIIPGPPRFGHMGHNGKVHTLRHNG